MEYEHRCCNNRLGGDTASHDILTCYSYLGAVDVVLLDVSRHSREGGLDFGVALDPDVALNQAAGLAARNDIKQGRLAGTRLADQRGQHMRTKSTADILPPHQNPTGSSMRWAKINPQKQDSHQCTACRQPGTDR